MAPAIDRRIVPERDPAAIEASPIKPRRLALWLWYRGDRFRGFQSQVGGDTVQQTLEAALAELGEFGGVFPAGRTDRDVHARMQVVGVRAPAEWEPEALARALNEKLPEGVGVACARVAPKSFHPQWGSVGKRYRYRVQLGDGDPAWAPFAWRAEEHPRLVGAQVDPTRMGELLRRCEGTRDFFAFHANSSVRKQRTLERAEWIDCGRGRYEVRLSGSGFARYQVRILVGTCAAVAAGVLRDEQLDAALERAEPIEGIRAPGAGLVLWEVRYPREVDPFTGADCEAQVPQVPPFIG